MHCGARMVVRDERSGKFDAYSGLEPWAYLGVGLLLAPALAILPIVQYMGWFLSSLVHEMGHSAAAWLCGMPAFPAISLEGHAAAMHSEQIVPLALFLTLALCFCTWRVLAGRARWIGCAAIVVVHTLLCFTPAREVLHLLAGHLAEFGFSCMCLFRALSGGYTSSRTERALWGTLGWFLLGRNVWLCWGLVTSGGARALYHTNGSFGLTNDYLRLADDVLGWPLQAIAGAMLFVGLLVLPGAIMLWRAYVRAQ
jgi:hypothetical protein